MKKNLVLLLALFAWSYAYADLPTDDTRQKAIDEALDSVENSSAASLQQPVTVRKHKIDFAFQTESFQYETGDKWPYYYSQLYTDSDKVKKSGSLYGFYGSKTWNLYAPLHTWSDLWKNYEIPNFARFEVESSWGKTDYSSYVTGKLKGFDAWNIDGRLLLGYDFASNSSAAVYTPYLGIGYNRYTDKSGGWVDYFVNDYARFTNVYSMFYLPIGLETLMALNDQWDVNFKMESDVIVAGKIAYQLNEIPGTFPGYDVNTGAPLELSPRESDSNLRGGIGFRTSLKLIKKGKYYDVFFEPFFRFLYLNKSQPVQASSFAVNNGLDYVSVYPDKSPYKPLWDEKNYTVIFGARTGLQF